VTKKVKTARKYYKKHLIDINSYGLVLLHGPINCYYVKGSVRSDCELKEKQKQNYCFNYKPSEMLGTLLLGDTSLKGKNSLAFPDEFNKKLKYIHVVQVPHHGSSKNWNSENFKKLNIDNSITWENNILAVCNCGANNSYKHPHEDIRNYFVSKMKTLYVNTECSGLTIAYNHIRTCTYIK
ncbi:MAG: hypothetical protein ABL940_07825, partial [Bacteroidia bacterium]